MIGFDARFIVLHASQLVHAGLEAQQAFFRAGQRLDTPGLAIVLIDFFIIPDDAPIGTDNALEMILVAQQILNDVFAESISDILSVGVLIVRNGIVRHHGRRHLGLSLQFKGSVNERNHSQFEIATRIDGILANAEMRVTAGFARAAARPVFHHAVDRAHAPSVRTARGRLKRIAIGPGDIPRQVGVFAVSAENTEPARVGGNVYLRRKRRRDTQRAVLGGHHLAVLAHDIHIECRRHTEFVGPLRNVTGGHGAELSVQLGGQGIDIASINANESFLRYDCSARELPRRHHVAYGNQVFRTS